MRGPNAIDFWRGFALASIFINHIPGNVFERLTHRNLSISDSAELFVFLAGWSLGYAVRPGGPEEPPARIVVMKLVTRAVQIHGAQLLMTVLALALLAAAAIWYEDPLILSWHHAEAFFVSPAPTLIGIVLLSHQLGYFNILPLYVVLMHVAFAIVLVGRRSPGTLLLLSLALYLATLVLEVNLPSWPVSGRWFLNPLAWQLLFVLGFLIADDRIGAVRWLKDRIGVLRIPALLVTAAGAWLVLARYEPDPVTVPWPQLLFSFNKTFLSPARILQFLALVVAFSGAFAHISRATPWPASYFSLLGRNSLGVFCVGSLLSLVAQLVRYQLSAAMFVDACVILIGLILLGVTAWLSEWRQRLGGA